MSHIWTNSYLTFYPYFWAPDSYPEPKEKMPIKIFEPQGQTGADIQAAINAASAAGSGMVLLDAISYTDVAVSIPSNNIYIQGTGKTRLLAPATGAVNIISVQGTQSPWLTLTADVAQFSDTISISSAALLAPGHFIEIQTVPPGIQGMMLHRAIVLSVNGNNVTFTPTVPFSVQIANPNSVRPYQPISGIKVSGVTFEANGNADVTRGFFGNYLNDSYVEECRFNDFSHAAALYLLTGFGNRCDGVYAYNCGSGAENDISIWRQTIGDFTRIVSRQAFGFGPGLYQSTNCSGRSWSSIRAGSRGIKFSAAIMCGLDDIESHQSWYTGIAISNGCHRLQLNRVVTCSHRGLAGSQIGLWFADQGDTYISINGLIAKNNGEWDITMFPTDSNNTIRMADYDTLYNTGTNNIIQR